METVIKDPECLHRELHLDPVKSIFRVGERAVRAQPVSERASALTVGPR
jgi:hypothetical protein